MSDQPNRAREAGTSAVELIADQDRVNSAEALITVRTGLTDGKTFMVKINQPAGRPVLVAVHL